MMDKLLPATDGGVAVQTVLAALILSAALVSVRRNREMRLLVIGLMTITAAFFALRTLH